MRETMERGSRDADLIVVGGGLAGLIAAALVARERRSVIVLDRAAEPGGRAVTHILQGVRFNLGPHALYCGGHAFRILRDLQIPFTGRFPRTGRPRLLASSATYGLPRGLGSLLGSRLLSAREKWRLVRLLGSLPRLDTRPLDRTPLGAWIARTAGTGNLARLLEALVRVSTYADDPGRLSAGAALEQLKLALAGNVWYLDGGWQTLVDGLRDAAVRHGARIRGGARAEAVWEDGDGVSVRLAGGEILRAGAAILAVGPETTGELLQLAEDAPLSRWTADRVPVRASCLDVALARLPRPECRFALGLDRPHYYSVHSATAELAPDGVAVVHVMKYLGSGPVAAVDELEAILDRLQPGARDHGVVARRFLPGMTVAHALPRADEGGLSGRPGVAVEGLSNLFLAGDWVGARGMLADASAASAEEAARRALSRLGQTRIPAGGTTSHVGI